MYRLVRSTRLASTTRYFSHVANTFESKYAHKLNHKARQAGQSLADLKAKAKAEEQTDENANGSHKKQHLLQHRLHPNLLILLLLRILLLLMSVKTAPPVKPLSSLLNIPLILSPQSPTTPAQLSALWTAYHASRSGGTGRGYVCASVPVGLYENMIGTARKYGSFIVPVPRLGGEGGKEEAYEFYFLQWAFHGSPPIPSATPSDPFVASPLPIGVNPNADGTPLPPTSTVLFTPLQEYKLRASFATPFLALTFYPDLARSHGNVLLRGEITASPGGGGAAVEGKGDEGGRFMLTQNDAQLLVMELQKFYLWESGKSTSTAERLLKTFHERPEEFKWEELLEHAKLTA
ncbi:hypothetical protein SERLADRAFT_359833 [Serpula lacrymans var. lacrymans S7.9]|uniref:ATP11-domain-containing protein n=1 Tax=Serpula lacrymans var. lacrymans (strain S7.9) TaxID=578457 RepID=F8NKT0_SERL9|nr:uncharacterized protein SERLADRAFT_359833 [Serpula lacrymans var. lacrymans S7.9]EGO28492.1 hypothetical protein SERLADRAFT_359833 [Serpula lacrymans var. lacrymans S7.9]